MFALLVPVLGMGQLRVTQGDQLPSRGHKDDYYYHLGTRLAYRYDGKQWLVLAGGEQVEAVIFHNGQLAFMTRMKGITLIGPGGELNAAGGKVRFEGRYTIVDQLGVDVYDSVGNHVWQVDLGRRSTDYSNYPLVHIVQGIPSVVRTVSDTLPGLFQSGVSMMDRRGWGVYSMHGKWLIEPLYDGPFEFVDGKAEVALYGEKFRIDEYGRRVE